MNLNNFERYIDKKILARGFDYFRDGCVTSLEETQDNLYIAQVEGTDLYCVEVQLDDQGNIFNATCDCPYDMGDYCKHQVAVFLTLRNELKNGSGGEEFETKKAGGVLTTDEPALTKNDASTSVNEMLRKLSKDQLVSFLNDIASDYPEIKQLIELNFGSENEANEIKQSVKLIRTYIQKQSDRHGFVRYGDTFEAVKGAEMVLEKASDACSQRKIMHSLQLILCVVHEMIELLENSDDSDGTVGTVIEDSFQQIDELLDTDDLSPLEKERLYIRLSEEAANQRYDGWSDWRLDLLQKCSWLADSPSLRKQLEGYLQVMVNKEKGSAWSSNFFAEQVNMIRYRLIERYDGEKKAQEFTNQHLQYSDFRTMAIEQALQQKDYDLVIELAKQGEEQDKNLPGLLKKWKEYRYKACQLLGRNDEQQSIAMDFILDGDFDYYLALKGTHTLTEWASIYPRIIFILENQKRTFRNVYTSILIEEGEKQKLLEYVQGSPQTVENYYEHLLPDFKEEILAVFLLYIEQTAAKASSRQGYQDVCRIICTLKKAGGHEQALRAKLMLLEKYPRRPAFRDELNQIEI